MKYFGERRLEQFLNTADKIIVQKNVTELSVMGYRSRLLIDQATDYGEIIAVIRYILGALLSIVEYNEDEKRIRTHSELAIAAIHQLNQRKLDYCKRWRLSCPMVVQELNEEYIRNARRKVLLRLNKKLENNEINFIPNNSEIYDCKFGII